MDSFTETTSESWFSRLGKSITGVLLGGILFLAGFPILFINEGCAVKNAKSLAELTDNLQTVEPGTVSPEMNGKAIYVTGKATTDETLTDPVFGITSPETVRLVRHVEMYQYDQEEDSKTEKKLGGGTETKTTYTYHTKWSSSPINSANFKRPEGHENPPMPYQGTSEQANNVWMGERKLTRKLIGQMGAMAPVTLNQEDLEKLPEDLKSKQVALAQGGYYVGANSGSPQIGDLKIWFTAVKPGNVSIIAAQNNDTFTGYTAAAGRTYEVLDMPPKSSQQMLADIAFGDAVMRWGMRFGGFMAMFIGLTMVFKPLSVLGDVVPFIGNLIGMGTAVVAGLIAVPCALITIAIAWIVFRPLLGIILIVVAVGLLFLLKKMRDKRVPTLQEASPATV